MRYVLDSSVAFKWEVTEADSGKAIRIRDEANQGLHQLLSPDVFAVEIAHALTRAERQGFAEILTGLVARERLCVLIIEHDLDFVRLISSRIIVLHQGRIALDGSVADVVDAPLVREIYTGRPASDGCGVTP